MYIHVDGSVNLHYTCPCQYTVIIMCDGPGGDNLRENPEPLIIIFILRFRQHEHTVRHTGEHAATVLRYDVLL